MKYDDLNGIETNLISIIKNKYNYSFIIPNLEKELMDNAYYLLKNSYEKLFIIKSAFPNNNKVTEYVVYMIKYNYNYWIVSYSENNKYCNAFEYDINSFDIDFSNSNDEVFIEDNKELNKPKEKHIINRIINRIFKLCT